MTKLKENVLVVRVELDKVNRSNNRISQFELFLELVHSLVQLVVGWLKDELFPVLSELSAHLDVGLCADKIHSVLNKVEVIYDDCSLFRKRWIEEEWILWFSSDVIGQLVVEVFQELWIVLQIF